MKNDKRRENVHIEELKGLKTSLQEFVHVYTGPMHSQTLHRRSSDVYSFCECIGTVYTCMNSCKEAFNHILVDRGFESNKRLSNWY